MLHRHSRIMYEDEGIIFIHSSTDKKIKRSELGFYTSYSNVEHSAYQRFLTEFAQRNDFIFVKRKRVRQWSTYPVILQPNVSVETFLCNVELKMSVIFGENYIEELPTIYNVDKRADIGRTTRTSWLFPCMGSWEEIMSAENDGNYLHFLGYSLGLRILTDKDIDVMDVLSFFGPYFFIERRNGSIYSQDL